MAEETTDEGTLPGAPPSPAPKAEGVVPTVAAAPDPAVEPVGSAAQATEPAQVEKAARRSRKLVTPAEAEATPPAAPAPPPLAEPVVVAPEADEPVVAATVALPSVTPPVATPTPAKTSKPLARGVGKPGTARPALAPDTAKPLPTGKAPAKAVPAKPTVTTRPGTGIPHAKVPAPLKTRVTHAAAAASRKEYPIMTTATDFSEKFQSVFKDASEKAKAAFEKSQAAFGDAGEFAKGNVEAVVESSKILASGLQELTKDYAAEGKSALETLTAEIKELASAKSPTEFFEKHTALLRKQFDAAVAASSKHSEAVLKLANEAFQPISNRVSLAVEKMKVAA